jgi:hypothetical protein
MHMMCQKCLLIADVTCRLAAKRPKRYVIINHEKFGPLLLTRPDDLPVFCSVMGNQVGTVAAANRVHTEREFRKAVKMNMKHASETHATAEKPVRMEVASRSYPANVPAIFAAMARERGYSTSTAVEVRDGVLRLEAY